MRPRQGRCAFSGGFSPSGYRALTWMRCLSCSRVLFRSARSSSASASFIFFLLRSKFLFGSGLLGPLEIHNLVQLVDDVDQIGLVGHDLGDRLVRVRVLVDQLFSHLVVPCPPRHCGSE